MTGLGSYVERFETNTRRRALRAAAAMAVGIPVAAVGFVLVVIADQSGNLSGMGFSGVVLGSGLGLALLGVTLACQTITRRGETFTLYEAGFMYSTAKTSFEVPWTAIETVVDNTKQNILAKAFCGDVGCIVKLTDGRKLGLNGFTEGAALLTRRIYEGTAPRASPS